MEQIGRHGFEPRRPLCDIPPAAGLLCDQKADAVTAVISIDSTVNTHTVTSVWDLERELVAVVADDFRIVELQDIFVILDDRLARKELVLLPILHDFVIDYIEMALVLHVVPFGGIGGRVFESERVVFVAAVAVDN